MVRPKAKAAPRFVEPEDESQDPEDQNRLKAEEPEEPGISGRRMSKTDAIRAAMAEGIESPGEGVDFIRKRFGLEMSKGHFSATKSKLKTSEGHGGKNVDQAKAAKSRPELVAERQASPEQHAGHSGNLLEALESIKPLIAQYGVEGVKRMADLLG